MQSNEVREKFLKFFESKGHKIMPSSSLIPEGDISVLFTTAGMQQFKPYYGAPENAVRDFENKNVVTVQKCVRTGDIDEVGDATHLSFFEMLGNFSFGGYGRKEAISYAHEFITSKEIGLGLEISYVTVLGDVTPFADDQESIDAWKELGMPDKKIIKQGIDDVFWGPTGNSGPCGPTTEIYCKNANGEDVEIWNIVFNQYFSKTSREQAYVSGWQLEDLPTLGIDTGMGLERLLATVQKEKNVYDTDLFKDILNNLVKLNSNSYRDHAGRIIIDHLRSASFMLADGVVPDNKGRGYIVRRLIRRALLQSDKIGLSKSNVVAVFMSLRAKYDKIYPELNDPISYSLFTEELEKFSKTLSQGLKEFEKMVSQSPSIVTGVQSSILSTSFGFPIELTTELAAQKGLVVDIKSHEEEIKKHQELSRTASAGMFKGGLANHNEQTIKLHTAHHLLLAGLQTIVNPDIKQRGSNITEERLRIDFVCDHKLTDEEKKAVEDWVNDKIAQGLDVIRSEMPLAEAEKIGAQMEFGAKYPEVVSVYMIGDLPAGEAGKNGNAISKEFCGGPHVANTSELGHFKIQKEEAVSAGVRRIKAILE